MFLEHFLCSFLAALRPFQAAASNASELLPALHSRLTLALLHFSEVRREGRRKIISYDNQGNFFADFPDSNIELN